LLPAVHELLRQSLSAWRIAGEVRHEAEATLLIIAGGKELRVRVARERPFRWMVDAGGRSRGALSIAGLLRAVRSAVDPNYRPVRLRIAPLPLVPS